MTIPKLKLKYDGVCYDCGHPLSAGTHARFFQADGKNRIACLNGEGCHKDENLEAPMPDAPQSGTQYKLTGPDSLSDGSSWADSKVDKPVPTPTTFNLEGAYQDRLFDVLDRIVSELRQITSELMRRAG